MKYTYILLLFFWISVYGKYIVPSSTVKDKYISIAIPLYCSIFKSFDPNNPNTLFCPLKSPTVSYFNNFDLDYCNYPMLLNNTLWKNGTFCQKMFCEEENILFNRLNQSIYDNDNTTIDEFEYFYSAYYSCKLCEIGVNQTYINGSFETCRWNTFNINNNSNLNCNMFTVYIYYRKMCYYPDLDMFISSNLDYETITYIYFYSFNIFLVFTLFFILLPFTIIFVAIPFIHNLILKLKAPMLTWKQKFFIIFNFQSFILVFLIMIQVIIPLLSIIDRFVDNNLSGVCLITGYFLMTLIYLCFASLYLNITQKNISDTNDSLQTNVIIFFFIFSSCIVIIFIILAISFNIPEIISQYIYFVSLILGSLILFIIGVIFFITSIVISFKLTFTSNGAEMVKMKVKFKNIKDSLIE